VTAGLDQRRHCRAARCLVEIALDYDRLNLLVPLQRPRESGRTLFGVPFVNYVGWAVVGLISLAIYFPMERRLPALPLPQPATPQLLLGVGLYYGVLVFNLGMTFWIDESFMGMSGLLMHVPVFALLMFRLVGPRRVS